ncbi:hypothetical protein [Liquorilactobacillus nagelii]|jgi:hypothetical protein|nr:hypothetical protein [Liquorilactobacillus nagelii]QYH53401.1 hypothetical protein G6O73_01290 [Liquorilactobacillus nagelii DSM 13675]
MKLTIEGNTEEIKNVLQAIGGSKEHKKIFKPSDNKKSQRNIPNPY